jgi:hydroxymethylbilane synthase
MTIRIASRGSRLALWQANKIGELLGEEYEIVEVATTGDVHKDATIEELGGIGAFAKEVQIAVLENRADVAVHSAKDLPSLTPDGLTLAAVPLRGDVRDVIIGSTLEELPYGARVGTGAQRRRAQLWSRRPDLQFEELRGNIDTRLEKAQQFDAVVLAHVALQRLNKDDVVSEILPVHMMLPAVAQGALAVEARSDDDETIAKLAKINNVDAFRCVTAERAFLETLGGGCTIPCGAFATPVDADTIWLRTMLAEPRGRKVIRVEQKGSDPRGLGIAVAKELLEEKGGFEIMEMLDHS